MPTDKVDFNIAEAVSKISEDINLTLEERHKDKYFEQVILLYSFIENILKWLVFTKIMRNKSDRILSDVEFNSIRNFSRNLSFYNAQRTALVLDIIDVNLYGRINSARKERNDIIHQFWLYAHRGNKLILRKKLEKLARIASDLVIQMNNLVAEIGVNEILEFML